MKISIFVILAISMVIAVNIGGGKTAPTPSETAADTNTVGETGPAAVEEPQPAAEQPAAEQPAAEQPAAEQPAAEQPAAEQPAAEQPVQRDASSESTEESGEIRQSERARQRSRSGKSRKD